MIVLTISERWLRFRRRWPAGGFMFLFFKGLGARSYHMRLSGNGVLRSRRRYLNLYDLRITPRTFVKIPRRILYIAPCIGWVLI